MIRHLRTLMYMPLALLLVAFQTAPPSICQQVIQTAMTQMDNACASTGRNQACYGNPMLEAEPQVGWHNFNFDNIGDIVDISSLQSLRLSAMNADAGLWGLALLRLQANIPHQIRSTSVTMVLFGDVEVRNQVQAQELMPVEPARTANVNVRRHPRLDGYVMGVLRPREIAFADGRTEDSLWYHVQLENGARGWVFASSVRTIAQPVELRVVEEYNADFGPMQAFLLNTGADTPGCEEAPENGLLIQTPDGVGTIDVWINEVRIRLGSTAFIQAQPQGNMTIQMIEGETEVAALGVDQVAIAGSGLNVPMSADLQPAAPPSLPEAYSAEDVAGIPVAALDRPIEIAAPISSEQLAQLINDNLADAETPVPPTVVPPTPLPPSPVPPTLTPRPTNTPVPPTSTPRPTDTAVPPTLTPRPTNTPVPPTPTPRPTDTAVPPTLTPRPTNTPVPPTSTPRPTDTTVPPTNTLVPPTPTPRPTDTLIPPPTNTTVPPTDTLVPPTNTAIPPTVTPQPTAVPATSTPVTGGAPLPSPTLQAPAATATGTVTPGD